MLHDPVWTTVALVGQVIFASRFVLQWIISEYKRRSHVPTAFWFISLAGSLILLCYSVHIMNPVFILGFAVSSLIYVRNIHLIYRHATRHVITAIEKGED
jgi:lipid-A-disaccharide synthase-like uncharacterized protein